MNKIMETKKRKYVKPKLTVAEWDFNEAVCDQQVAIYSYCPTIGGDSGTNTRKDLLENAYDDNIDWHRFTGSR